MKILDIFRIKVVERTVHQGRGFDTGDGVDIIDTVIEFGKFPHEWSTILLGGKIITNKNTHTFDWKGNYQIKPSEFWSYKKQI